MFIRFWLEFKPNLMLTGIDRYSDLIQTTSLVSDYRRPATPEEWQVRCRPLKEYNRFYDSGVRYDKLTLRLRFLDKIRPI